MRGLAGVLVGVLLVAGWQALWEPGGWAVAVLLALAVVVGFTWGWQFREGFRTLEHAAEVSDLRAQLAAERRELTRRPRSSSADAWDPTRGKL